MKRTALPMFTLALSSLIALGVGCAVLIAPAPFYAINNVSLPDDVSLLNDLRAFGGGLVALGLFVATGLVVAAFRLPALVAAALVYAGFGAARVFALIIDGVPDPAFVAVLVIELAVAALCLVSTVVAGRMAPSWHSGLSPA